MNNNVRRCKRRVAGRPKNSLGDPTGCLDFKDHRFPAPTGHRERSRRGRICARPRILTAPTRVEGAVTDEPAHAIGAY